MTATTRNTKGIAVIRTLQIFVIAAVLSISSTVISKDHPYNPDFIRQVHQLFLENGQVSNRKIDAYIARLRQKRSEIVGVDEGRLLHNGILLNEQREKKDFNASKVLNKLMEHEVYVSLTRAMQDLEKMKRTGGVEVYELAYSALDLENAITVVGSGSKFAHLIEKIEVVLSTWKVPFQSAPEEEATNLWNPASRSFLTTEQIRELKSRNVDLSLYSPKESTFWQAQQNISTVDVRAAAAGRTLDVYKGSNIQFPSDNTFVFDEMKQSDTKPKFIAEAILPNGKKAKFKIKLGNEINTEPTVGALMLTLGFPADVTKYAKNITVNLGKTSYKEFQLRWEEYYRRGTERGAYLIEDFIQSKTVDSKGQTVIVFKEGLIEARPHDIERLGAWAFSDTSHGSFREVRGLMALQIFFDNSDVKEEANNKLLLKTTPNGLRRFHIHSDPGFSLSKYLDSLPETFHPQVVSARTSTGLNFRYLSIQKNSIQKKMTFADVKWATRLIAQLTRSQIATALELGGWPQCIQEFYLERISSRRNDLVHHLGLLGQRTSSGGVIQLLPIRQEILQAKFEDHCQKSEIATPDTTINYDFDLQVLLKAVWARASGILADSATAAINGQRKIVIAADRFQLNPLQITEIIIDPKREIEQNPDPKSSDELFVVKDHLEIGVRLGAGFGVYKDLVYTRAFTLAYPTRTKNEGRYKNDFLINATLPFDISRGKLPDSYVLQTTHYLESGQGVNFDNRLAALSPGIRIGFADRVYLWRSVLDRRDPSRTILYRDKARYAQTVVDAFMRIGPLKLPFFEDLRRWGRATGRGVIFDGTIAPTDYNQISKAIGNGDFSGIAHLEQSFDLANSFTHKTRTWNALIFGSGRSDKRMDKITLSGESDRQVIQYATSSSKSTSVPLFLPRESKRLQVEVYVDPRTQPRQFQIHVSAVGSDSNTSERQLTGRYLEFINGLAPNRHPVIPFTPELGYSKNGNYGPLAVTSDTVYYPDAVTKILQMPDANFWSSFGVAMNLSPRAAQQLVTKVRSYMKSPIRGTRNNKDNLRFAGLTRKEFDAVRAAEKFLDRLKDVRKEKDLDDKVRKLAEAMKKAAYTEKDGFYQPTVFAALNVYVGENSMYSRNVIAVPPDRHMELIEDRPLIGEIGKARPSGMEYLIYTPLSAIELYTMFDSWF